MRFHKNVSRETRELLMEQLRQYEKEMRMTSDERKALHKWVASGRSPYDHGDDICTDGRYPHDCVSAMRFEEEQMEWYQGLSEEEKDELHSRSIGYNTRTDEMMVNCAGYFQADPNEELPFQ